eukprot:TRINITY_DN5889_c0_g1_i1.p1 TRINITY_DN5889_c0_g1~~TRINITY_DN5889_c0_g1_i1.p1  ORF type:complete len:339 (+),score=59.42 TRINITY_DN5889_c0_g1_i1:278-1294(+)
MIFHILLFISGFPGLAFSSFRVPNPIPQGRCADLQNDFIQGFNSMSACFTRNAPTGDYCQGCETGLLYLNDVYKDLKIFRQGPFNVSCLEVLCEQNDIGVLCRDYKYIHHLWGKSKCDHCYVNNTVSSGDLKPDVEIFISLVKNVSDCFRREENICIECQESYRQLSRKFFHEWYAWSESGGYQCRDIYDKYNVTMREWSEVHKCTREPGSPFLYPFLLLLFYIVILYFLFYFTVIFILPRQKLINLVELRSRTEVLPIDIPIQKPREELPNTSSEEEEETLIQEMSCPCFAKFRKFVQEYRDAREDYRKDDPPDSRTVAVIHKKYARVIHNSRNFKI